MKKWTILYYETRDGKSFVEDFIESRSVNNRAKIAAILELLEEKGAQMPRPYADYLRDEIYELRIKLSGDETRILYFFCYGDYIILTHTFFKRTQKVPNAEIEKAIKCKVDFTQRYSEKDLKKLLS